MREARHNVGAAEQLELAVSRWESTFDAVEDMVALVGTDYRILLANRAMKERFKGQEVVGAFCHKLIHGTDSPPETCQACKVFETGLPHRWELHEEHLGGCWLDVATSPIKDGAGKVQQIVHLVRDVTERKRAEEELKSLKQQMEFILGATNTGIDIIDSEFNIRYIDPEWRKVYGDPTGKKCYEYFMDRDDVCPGCGIVTALETKAITVTEEVLPKENNRPIQVTTMPFQNEAGEWLVAEVNTDITERKQAEEELEKHRHHLEELVRERTAELEQSLSEIRQLKERLEAENVYLRDEIRMAQLHGDIVGDSEALRAVVVQAEQVAETDSTVLLLGETGTGKELLARAIHNMSLRKDRPLVVVNCAAMPSTLVESELFGREKGAYTGALTKQIGRFEVADGGTVFLDEIGELSGEIQAKLLRVLEEGKFERLGSAKSIAVDVRIIAATNRDVEREVEDGRFRRDLFYRLNVFPITIPPLRERPEDIPALVWAFVKEFAESMGKKIESVPRRNMEALQGYPWPGNVRELRNTIERAMIRTTGPVLKIELPHLPAGDAGPMTLAEREKQHILHVLEATGWRIRGANGAAEILDLKPSTLESRMSKLGIHRPKRDPR